VFNRIVVIAFAIYTFYSIVYMTSPKRPFLRAAGVLTGRGVIPAAAQAPACTPSWTADVDQIFSARKIKRGKNLIYNTLSYLVAQKKLQRRDGPYFGVVTVPVAQSQSAAHQPREA